MTARPTEQADLLTAIAEAEAEKDRAFANLDAADVADENAVILAAITRLADTGQAFSANDLRALLPDDVNRNRIGRQFARAQELGLIQFAGLVKSSDKGTHGKKINTYVRAVAA